MTDPRSAFNWQTGPSIMHTATEERRAQAIAKATERAYRPKRTGPELTSPTNANVPLTGHATHQIAPPYSAAQQDKRRKLLKAAI